jgi:hypothetical protein
MSKAHVNGVSKCEDSDSGVKIKIIIVNLYSNLSPLSEISRSAVDQIALPYKGRIHRQFRIRFNVPFYFRSRVCRTVESTAHTKSCMKSH